MHPLNLALNIVPHLLAGTWGPDAEWGEHEMDYILFIRADVTLDPNPEEVMVGSQWSPPPWVDGVGHSAGGPDSSASPVQRWSQRRHRAPDALGPLPFLRPECQLQPLCASCGPLNGPCRPCPPACAGHAVCDAARAARHDGTLQRLALVALVPPYRGPLSRGLVGRPGGHAGERRPCGHGPDTPAGGAGGVW